MVETRVHRMVDYWDQIWAAPVVVQLDYQMVHWWVALSVDKMVAMWAA